jgi:hypothetical protein
VEAEDAMHVPCYGRVREYQSGNLHKNIKFLILFIIFFCKFTDSANMFVRYFAANQYISIFRSHFLTARARENEIVYKGQGNFSKNAS